MSKEALIFEISDRSFEKYVIANSNKVPVFVVFMHIWSEPCIQLVDLLSTLATEFPEEFILAKVDIDENQGLVETYKINNVPTLKIIVNEEVVATEEGLLSEEEARVLLKGLGIVNEIEEARIQARQYHIQGDTPKAVELLTAAIRKQPSSVKVVMDMIQIFIDLSELDQAKNLFERLPAAIQNSETGLGLSGQIWINEQANKTAGIDALQQAILVNPDDSNSRFDFAICEMARHDIDAALVHLFYIQQHDATFKEGAAKELIITIINTIAPNNPEAAKKYRAQLGALVSG